MIERELLFLHDVRLQFLFFFFKKLEKKKNLYTRLQVTPVVIFYFNREKIYSRKVFNLNKRNIKLMNILKAEVLKQSCDDVKVIHNLHLFTRLKKNCSSVSKFGT